MTAEVIVTTRNAPGLPAGTIVTIDPVGKLRRADGMCGRMHLVLTINGEPAEPDTWVLGRTLAVGAA